MIAFFPARGDREGVFDDGDLLCHLLFPFWFRVLSAHGRGKVQKLWPESEQHEQMLLKNPFIRILKFQRKCTLEHNSLL